jgi:hypothetical protein
METEGDKKEAGKLTRGATVRRKDAVADKFGDSPVDAATDVLAQARAAMTKCLAAGMTTKAVVKIGADGTVSSVVLTGSRRPPPEAVRA